MGTVKQESTVTENDFSQEVVYTVQAEDGSQKDYVIITYVNEVPSKPNIAHLYIQTEGGVAISSKEKYVHGSLVVDGMGTYPDYSGEFRIRGRGNSTWHHPKKPYRIKLDKSSSILGLPEDKDWILLSNYLDGTLMLNAIALKTGQLLELPYTNT